MTILIVDDDLQLLDQLTLSLERKRYRVETAANGFENGQKSKEEIH